MKIRRQNLHGLALVASIGLTATACGRGFEPGQADPTISLSHSAEDDDGEEELEEVEVLSPEEMTNRSARFYRNNKWGLVTPATVKGWLDDWPANKPAHIKGRLFVMQMGQVFPGDDAHNYLKHDDVNTFTFDRTDACADVGYVRNDGVSIIANAAFSGEYMDMAFMSYGIDITKDMILLILGPGDPEILAGATRSWYHLSYWGVPPKQIAVMSGSAAYHFHPDINDDVGSLDDMFVAGESVMPMNGTVSIREIRRDGTILQASMYEMMELAAHNNDDAFILDARAASEYGVPNGKASKAETLTCGASGTEQCYTAFEGHIRNAHLLTHTDLLVTDDEVVDLNGDGVVNSGDASYSVRPIPELEQIFAAAGYEVGDTLYTYCRTGTRATVPTFIASAVLAYPARMYDGSWIQWGKMAAVADQTGNLLLPPDSPWRTDVDTYSVVSKVRNKTDGSTSSSAYVQAHMDGPMNAYVPYGMAGTNVMIEADKAYKQ